MDHIFYLVFELEAHIFNSHIFNSNDVNVIRNKDIYEFLTKISHYSNEYTDSYRFVIKSLEHVINKRDATRDARINTFVGSIESSFKLAAINSDNLYSSVDIKQIKTTNNNSFSDYYIKCIDQNVKGFLKNDRFYAGLAYLKDVLLSLKVECCFYLTFNEEEITFYPVIFWKYEECYRVDEKNLFNKISECLIVLLMNTANSNPLVDFYKNLHEKFTLNLSADVLVKLIEALLKHGEIQLVENTISQLKKWSLGIQLLK